MSALELEKVDQKTSKKGKGTALVFIGGYLSDTEDERELDFRWWDGFRTAGWEGPMYRLHWDASTPVGGTSMGAMPIRLSLPGGTKAWIPASIAAGMGSAILHHREVKERTEELGYEEANKLLKRKLRKRETTLVAHSNGVRLAYHMLCASADRKEPMYENAVLFGGTVSRSADWEKALEGVTGQLINVYHPYDRVLTFYDRTFRMRRPVGLGPIQEDEEERSEGRFRDVDASEFRPSEWRKTNHWAYRFVIPEVCYKLFGGPEPPVKAAAS